jgi:hypothetical protein
MLIDGKKKLTVNVEKILIIQALRHIATGLAWHAYYYEFATVKAMGYVTLCTR